MLPLPKELLNGVVFFNRDEAAIDAVEAWRGVDGLRMLEYADVGSLKLIRAKFSDIPAEAVACVIVEQILDDDAALYDSALDEWELRLTHQGAMAEQSWFGSTDADRERFRVFRHSLPEQVLALGRQMGFPKMGSDFAVPVDKNREMLAFYRKRISDCFDAPHVIYGHIGDAHLHVNLFPGNAQQVVDGQELMREFAKKSVELGGTVAAEHGLGKRKRDFLPLMYSPTEIEAMKAVKLRLDPKWLLGCGNLFPISPAHPGA